MAGGLEFDWWDPGLGGLSGQSLLYGGDDPPGGSSPGGAGPGGAGPNPFIPLFSGGQAPGFGGFGPSATWGGGGMRRRRLPGMGGRMAFGAGASQPRMEGGGASMGGGGGPQLPRGWWNQSLPPGLQPRPASSGGPFEQGALGPIGALVQNAFLGGDPNYGGAFSLNPPSAIMSQIRGQAVQDAGARERAARLGLQARGDADPSTYGFQALQSQLGGQRDTANAMNQADLGLRQQQLQQYWQLLSQLLAGQLGVDQTERQGRWNQANQPSPWGPALGGIGAALAGRGG